MPKRLEPIFQSDLGKVGERRGSPGELELVAPVVVLVVVSDVALPVPDVVLLVPFVVLEVISMHIGSSAGHMGVISVASKHPAHRNEARSVTMTGRA